MTEEKTMGAVCASAIRATLSEHDKIVDYRTQFEELWSDDFAVQNSVKRVFVVWDGVPNDSRAGRIAPYLTALDWVLAFSLKIIRTKDAYKDFSIHLIDMTSNRFDSSFSAENAPTLLEAMPWVTLYAPLKHDRSAFMELSDPEILKTGNGWANAKKSLQEAANNPSLSSRLERLADMWQAWLTRSDDHHDVNNTAGPLRLSQKKEDIKNTTTLQKAFATRLDWVAGKLSENQKLILERLPKYVSDTKTKLNGGKINIVLVDDMCQFGWGTIFEQWCGVSQNDLTLIDKPSDLLEEMKEWHTNDFLKRDFGFCFNLSVRDNNLKKGNNQSHQVIFLDLRLHGNPANKVTNERNEHKFYENLIQLIDKWGLTKANNQFAWQPISKEDCDHVKEWLEGIRKNRPLEIHSLLPRIIALRSPHIPIIVLSSTRKRSVIEPLKPYGNIFTALEKPQVIGSDNNTLERFHSCWQEAWNHAAMLLQTNKHMQSIEDRSNNIKKKTPSSEALPKNPYVEIYIDEAGTTRENFVVGGVIAIYNDSDSSFPYDEFDDKLFEAGMCYYDPLVPPRATHSPALPIKKKREPCHQEIKTALENNSGCAPNIFTFRMRYNDCTQLKSPLEETGDYLYFQTVIKALECILFESLPTYLHNNQFELSIYLATRHIPIKYEEECWSLMKRWGYSPFDSKHMDTVTGSCVLPILSQLFGERDTDARKIKPDRFLAVTLKYENKPEDKDSKKKNNPMFANRFYCKKCDRYLSPSPKEVREALKKQNMPVNKISVNTGERHITIPEVLSLMHSKSSVCNHNNWVPDYRALHYLSDEVLDISKLHAYKVAGINIDEIPGFEDINDDILKALLQASRVAEQGDSALALIMAFSALRQGTPFPEKSVKEIILARLTRCLPNLSGVEYLKIAKATYDTKI